MIELDAGFSIRSLAETDLEKFVCDEKLLSFFHEDAQDTEDELIAKIYFLHHENIQEPLVGFCVSNSAIQATNDLNMTLPDNVHHKSYPAVLLGKLATHSKYTGKKYGQWVIEFLKIWFITQNKTGCRYLVADSLPDAVGFYAKCGFEEYPVQKSSNTKLMFFDLKAYELTIRYGQEGKKR
ncbi:MAG TPA: GNAT family N-acetyltransferase [Turneriella sp.]|nr:GNAT family N-acetyltransferase [Turneriella sp.]